MPTAAAPACSTSSSAAPACVAGLVSEAEYAQQVELAKLFLAGKNQQVIGELVGKMESASGDLRFEEAARYRDQIQALRRVTEQQSVSGNVLDELDVVGWPSSRGPPVSTCSSSARARCWARAATSRKCRYPARRGGAILPAAVLSVGAGGGISRARCCSTWRSKMRTSSPRP